MTFPFQPYYANANHLRQAEAVLIVSTQVIRARTLLPESLNHFTNPHHYFYYYYCYYCYYQCPYSTQIKINIINIVRKFNVIIIYTLYTATVELIILVVREPIYYSYRLGLSFYRCCLLSGLCCCLLYCCCNCLLALFTC